MGSDMDESAAAGMSGKDLRRATERVVSLEAELESAGEATLDAGKLEASRAVLHAWVDSVVAVVSSPGVGRVTLIHANGRQSNIASPDLPFALSLPAGRRG